MNRKACTLLLPGIYPQCEAYKLVIKAIKDGDEETIYGRIAMKPVESIVRTFTTLAEWPKTTRLCCWECGLPIEGMPVYIPWPSMNVVNGYYCSGPCGAHCIMKKSMNETVRSEMMRMFLMVLNILYNRSDITKVMEASDRTELVQYGGGKHNNITFKRHIKDLEVQSKCVPHIFHQKWNP